MPAIVLNRVSFSYGDLQVIHEADVCMETGEFVGIIGPNGGGKTTLVKLMMGLLEPTEGKVELFGRRPSEQWGEIGYVPQAMPFDRWFPLTLLDLVLEGTLSHAGLFYGKRMRSAAMAALKRVGLEDLAKRPFGSLSGGQMQRGLIARALVLEPKLLLLDEPTASVDPQAEADIHQFLQRLKGEITMVMVTHNLDVAIHQVERVLCVQNEVVALAPEKVCEHFAVGLYHPPLLEDQ